MRVAHDVGIDELRSVALANPEAHLFKFRGRHLDGSMRAFGALALPEEAFVEGGLRVPKEALRVASFALHDLVWDGEHKPMRIVEDRKAYDHKKLLGYITHQWVIDLHVPDVAPEYRVVEKIVEAGLVRRQTQSGAGNSHLLPHE